MATVKYIQKLFFLFSLCLVFIQCNRNPCKTTVCQNGGAAVEKFGDCGCSCPKGYIGEHCETKLDYMKFKVNGVAFESIAVASIDTAKGPKGTYRTVAGFTTIDTANVVALNFYKHLGPGTYHPSNLDFVGLFFKNSQATYQSTGGDLVLTDTTKAYQGTFAFMGRLFSAPFDTVVVTEGEFYLAR